MVGHAAAECYGALPRSQMAAITIGGQISGIVIVDVARGARRFARIRVRSSQDESSSAVIKHPSRPRGDGMAGRALRRSIRKAGGNVIRNSSADSGSAIPGSHVAAIAVGRIERVVVADVAGRAGCRRGRHVRADQRESCDAVIEGGRVPTTGGVAVRAICGRKRGACRGVHRIVGALPSREVAAGIAAIRWGNFQCVVAVHVAQIAGHRCVFVSQRESGGAVIKLSISPFGNGMARGTSRSGIRKSGSDVIRHAAAYRGSAIPIGHVAAVAIRRIQREVSADVASSAGRRRGRHMRSNQSETGCAVIEFSVGPCGDSVAGSASRRGTWESRSNVIRDVAADGRGFVPIGQMATHAIRRIQRVVVADVAGRAGRWRRRHVRADKRKPRDAVVERSGVPAFCGVAVRTIR